MLDHNSIEGTSTSEQNKKPNLIHRGILLIAAMVAMFGWFVMTSRILSDFHPFWDIATHMSWHAWLALSATVLASLAGMRFYLGDKRTRWWHRLIMVVPPWLYLAWVTAPLGVLPIATNVANAHGLKILSWNMWMFNKDTEAVIRLVQDSNADVVILIEIGAEQAKSLKSLESKYPHCHWLPDHTSRGIAMLSRIEGTKFKTVDLASQGMPAIEAEIPKTDRHASFQLMGVHTRSPGLNRRTRMRNKQLASLAEWASTPGQTKIIMGDLNITPWSKPFSRLLHDGNLQDSRRYRGNYASWPTDLGLFAIPIDHALVSRDATILYRSVGPIAPDSDHRPIEVIVK